MRRNRGGFTILEVMIFLTISGALLSAAMVAINGQQNRTEFTQAMRDIDSKLQDTFNDVSTGNFSYQNNQDCTVDISGKPQLVAGTGQIGSRSACIFLGEAVQFSTSDNSRFATYTVLGRRLKNSTIPGNQVSVGSFAEANPTAMIGGGQDLTSYYNFQQGITVSHIYYTPPLGVRTDGAYTLLGLYSAFTAAAGNIGNSTADSAQTLQTYTYKLGNTAFDTAAVKTCIDSNGSGACTIDQSLSSANLSKGFGICFDSNNGTTQTALITIYGTAQGVSTRLDYNPPVGTC